MVVAGAVLVLYAIHRDRMLHPWTRDGQVCAQVIQVAPRVSGPIVNLPVVDNQVVTQGQLLFQIDRRTFDASVYQAVASVTQASAAAEEALDLYQRDAALYKLDSAAISIKDLNRRRNAAREARAAVHVARAALRSAELDLGFTDVRAPVDGFITGLRLRLGSQTVANTPVLALIDAASFWVHGFFQETQIRTIQPGDSAIVTLMSYPDAPLTGVVDSIGWGIAQGDGAQGNDLLPDISPTFDWIRLAQRIPVRIHLLHVPADVQLRVGTTASVVIDAATRPSPAP
jgi:RND family efflux transporter MFP subunit